MRCSDIVRGIIGWLRSETRRAIARFLTTCVGQRLRVGYQTHPSFDVKRLKGRQHVREFTIQKIFSVDEIALHAIGVELRQLIDDGFIFQFSSSLSEVEFTEPKKDTQITRSV